jgi:hypothetical protein
LANTRNCETVVNTERRVAWGDRLTGNYSSNLPHFGGTEGSIPSAKQPTTATAITTGLVPPCMIEAPLTSRKKNLQL